MNEIRDTIVHKIKENLKGVKVVTNIDDMSKETITTSNIRVLFRDYGDKNNKELEVIDYDSYTNYLKEVEPNVETDTSKELYVLFNGVKNKVISYNKGKLVVDKEIENLYPYNDVITIGSGDEDINDNKDFIYVYSAYSFSNVLNFKYVEYIIRFNFDIFLYKDLDNLKFLWYNKMLSKLFHRSFNILNKESKTVGNTVSIQSPLSFMIAEDNKDNKIVRATMLLKIIEKE